MLLQQGYPHCLAYLALCIWIFLLSFYLVVPHLYLNHEPKIEGATYQSLLRTITPLMEMDVNYSLSGSIQT